jgi:hypothetical protein
MKIQIKTNNRLLGVRPESIQKVVKVVLEREYRAVEKDYESTVKTWKRQPSFEGEIATNEAIIGTDNKIYGYLENGTPAHPITAKRAPFLAFYRTGFVSKTTPQRLPARRGKKANQDFRLVKRVKHPGIEARNFSTRIAKRAQRRLKKEVAKELEIALNRPEMNKEYI